ncbi:MAG: hypothetical protein ACR2N3_14320 [Pyrinomonadaceae bacterium]
MFLFDVAVVFGGSTVGILIGAAFLFIALASGAFAFVMLRKTVRIAIRMFVVAAILLIAVVGSLALYLFLKPAPKYDKPLLPHPSPNSVR